ncbi:AraC family transcriptional regulator [Paenibacillus eucommiae]|uniref:AraC-like DNA-binding protein/mannose-6-phosphate isomerase-like protein (Cupin superfamily) n=1 Tax=Paenibacillus eucommiae TaxID=1355755 RepID=A0ABS4J9E2_9BACL|nr:AraC family transcriptional regulator [Paenibacillus eucommiae]MBP1995875.1 AraC-like DNA-binding protein/mannose-6-phosphate isomerase-like protein (cupin superfamily) [Paenibacillus eucommiae]
MNMVSDSLYSAGAKPFYYEPMLENPMALDRLDIRFRWGRYGIRVLHCHFRSFPPGFSVDYHHHSEYELHYIPRGKGKVILEGQAFSLQEGMLYVTGPGVTHYQEADAFEAMDELCLHVDIVPLEPEYQADEGAKQDGHAEWGQSTEIAEAEAFVEELAALQAVPAMDVQDAMECFLTAYLAWRDSRLGQFEIIKQSILQILLRTIAAYSTSKPNLDLPSRDMKSYRYQLAVHFIQDNYRRPITLESVSERVKISPRQLQRIFKEQAGTTFSEHLERVRLIHVSDELRQSDRKLEHIAESNGFASSNYLHYVFKKTYGMTPMQFRTRARLKAETK